MTGETGESAVTIAEASGAVQISRLVAHVPAIAPIGIVIQIACLTMACAAQSIDLDRRQSLRVLNRSCAGRLHVSAPGPVAGFTVDARLARLYLKVRR
jgi:hypothetical protein